MDLLAAPADSSADNEGLGCPSLRHRYPCKGWPSEDRAYSGYDDGLETTLAEVQDLFASSPIYRRVSLFQL